MNLNDEREYILFKQFVNSSPQEDPNSKLHKVLRQNFHKEITQLDQCLVSSIGGCNKVIKAHTIQNNRILSKLSNSNNEVVFLDQSSSLSYQNRNIFIKNKNNASIFKGFCRKHDSIFNPIELNDYQEGNQEQNFLFAFRAFAKYYSDCFENESFYRRYDKLITSEKIDTIMRRFGSSEFIIDSQKNIDVRKAVALKNHNFRLKLLSRIRKDNNDNLGKYIYYLNNSLFEKFETLVFKFDLDNRVAVSSTVYLPVDIFGGKISNYQKAPLYLSVFPQHGQTFCILTYELTTKKILQPFLNQLHGLEEEKNLTSLFSNLIIRFCDNIAFNTDYFLSLNKKDIKDISNNLGTELIYPKYGLLGTSVNLFE